MCVRCTRASRACERSHVRVLRTWVSVSSCVRAHVCLSVYVCVYIHTIYIYIYMVAIFRWRCRGSPRPRVSACESYADVTAGLNPAGRVHTAATSSLLPLSLPSRTPTTITSPPDVAAFVRRRLRAIPRELTAAPARCRAIITSKIFRRARYSSARG